VQGNDRETAFDTVTASMGAAIAADRTVVGLCDWVEAGALRPVDLPIECATRLKAAVIRCAAFVHGRTTGLIHWRDPDNPRSTRWRAPVRGFTKMLFAGTSLGAEQRLLNPEPLG
jgi:hypothetical protein